MQPTNETVRPSNSGSRPPTPTIIWLSTEEQDCKFRARTSQTLRYESASSWSILFPVFYMLLSSIVYALYSQIIRLYSQIISLYSLFCQNILSTFILLVKIKKSIFFLHDKICRQFYFYILKYTVNPRFKYLNIQSALILHTWMYSQPSFYILKYIVNLLLVFLNVQSTLFLPN